MTATKARDHRRLYRRLFLNKPHHESTASILTEVRYNQSGLEHKRRGGAGIFTQFQLSDCTRKVELEFGAHVAVQNGVIDRADLAALANTEHKARVLQDEVTRFTECVLSACQDIRDHAWAVAEYQIEQANKIDNEETE